MSFIDSLELQPADPIFGLTEEFKADTSDKKINLGVGVYQSDEGEIFEEQIVRTTAQELSATEPHKSYLPIGGSPSFCANVAKLLFGEDSKIVTEKRAATVHTPGGTGALRLAGELLYKNLTAKKDIYISKPSWPNHHKIFGKAFGSGFNLKDYPYYDYDNHSILFSDMIAALNSADEGSAVLLHLCCHNPTGADMSLDQWQQLAECIKTNSLIPVVDCAYQGFAINTLEDRKPFAILDELGIPFIAAQSFSKTFSLYGERTGALHVVCRSSEEAARVRTNLTAIARPIYSNPPSHGGKVVDAILSSDEKNKAWANELSEVQLRIDTVRAQFCDMLADQGFGDRFGHIRGQNGMFSITGLDPAQVEKLKTDFHIYMPKSGRVCIAALNSKNIEYVVNSIASVLAS